ncbi:DNA gyrase subunit A [Candidatus Mycoplasma pogonae]
MLFFDKKDDEMDKEKDPYHYEEEELKTVFDSATASVQKIVEIEEEEEIPQLKESYTLESKIIDEETEYLAPRNVVQEMRESFLEYAMSVIISRALPDARDGLKPVHRRILYGMSELGMFHGSAFKKSARIVGDVLGKYHPHGDSSVYESMVRMAQDFSLRYPLIDGQGNFGSIDGDSAAAMRYTEARMSKIAGSMVEGIKKNTVDFVPNYDDSETEPAVLPSRFPNLLVSGATGIAVGMATAIPPHNLNEVINATIALAQNPNITIDELMQHVSGPDFPTGAIILGRKGIVNAYHTGRGSIAVRSKTHIEVLKNGKSRIVVTEIPYEMKKPAVITKIAELVKAKILEGISDLRDESSREGIRIVIELKKGIIPEVMLNKLFKMTNLQQNFSANIIALVKGEPKILNLKDALQVYLDFQIEVVTRRTLFDLDKANKSAHILEGLKIAVENIDKVIAIIRGSKNDAEAQEKLASELSLSAAQTKAIVDMRLGRLTGLAINKMNEELAELKLLIAKYQEILNSREKLIALIIEELSEIRDKFGDKRRTEINSQEVGDILDEDLISKKDVVITVSSKGYVKRIPLEEYRTQNRGGVGANTATTYEDDNIELILTANTHVDLLIFTNYGKVYRLRTHQLPEQSKQAKGTPFVNLLPIDKDEKVVSLLAVKAYDENHFLVTVTKLGVIKKTALTEYQRINNNGKLALGIRENDSLFKAFVVSDNEEILIGASNGKVVRFDASQVRSMGRVAAGVKGISLTAKEFVTGASKSSEGAFLFSLGSKGFGKKTALEEYRKTSRGTKGVLTIDVTKAGKLAYIGVVQGDEDILVITSDGIAIRTSLQQVNETSRATKGVKIINLKDKQEIKSLAKIDNIEKSLETAHDLKNSTESK